MTSSAKSNRPMRHLTMPQNDQPNSYIAALKHFAARARSNAPLDRKIVELRNRSDAELGRMGIDRAEIEQMVYGRVAT